MIYDTQILKHWTVLFN
uniref:Uncharacterized protein n=1 Tax=Arundo donax TaxID=35708 RepID=A0A0A9FJP8_ARUDO